MITLYDHLGIRLTLTLDQYGDCVYRAYVAGTMDPELVTYSLADTLKWAKARTGYPFDTRQVVNLIRSHLQL